jgi:hypothetical protein
MCFYVGTIQRICFVSDDSYSDSTLILAIAVKRCMDICGRPHAFGVFLMFLTFPLTLAEGLCCAWFIYPLLCWC